MSRSYRTEEILSLADTSVIVSRAMREVDSPEQLEARMLIEASNAAREWDAINLFSIAWECRQWRGKGAEFAGV